MVELWDKIEKDARVDLKKFRGGAVGAGSSRHEQGVDAMDSTPTNLFKDSDEGVRSATPKTAAPRIRVKKRSRFCSSPFDSNFEVTADMADVYKMLLLHTSKSLSSRIKE